MKGIAGRQFSLIASALIALSLAIAAPARAEQKVLRGIPQADLKVLDTHFNSIQVTKIYALMASDTLYAWASHFQPKPQMAEPETESPDKLTSTSPLPPGLQS